MWVRGSEFSEFNLDGPHFLGYDLGSGRACLPIWFEWRPKLSETRFLKLNLPPGLEECGRPAPYRLRRGPFPIGMVCAMHEARRQSETWMHVLERPASQKSFESSAFSSGATRPPLCGEVPGISKVRD